MMLRDRHNKEGEEALLSRQGSESQGVGHGTPRAHNKSPVCGSAWARKHRTGLLVALVLTILGTFWLRHRSPPVALYFPITTHPTYADRISIGVISSKGTFDRVEQFAMAWKTPEMRFSVWVDTLPLFMHEELEPLTFKSTASTHDWWKKTKQDHHTRLAWTIYDMVEMKQPGVDWYLVVDDDTIVFVDGLVAALSKYDPEDLWYIGNISEDAHQVQYHGRMAYGGGGIAISRPLAEKLHASMSSCLPRYDGVYGQDSRVFGCVSELDIPLTIEAGFHQLDLSGDISGLLEAHPRSPAVTLHHLQQLDPVFPQLTTANGLALLLKGAKALGASFLQQSVYVNRHNHWTFSLAEGYSLKWFVKAKLAPWVKSVEMTFDRFMNKHHDGPMDWTMDSKRRFARCKHYDAFLWSGTEESAARGLRSVYERDPNPLCQTFPGVQRVLVRQLPGAWRGRPCKMASDATLSSDLTMELCGTFVTHQLEFQGSSEQPSKTELKALRASVLAAIPLGLAAPAAPFGALLVGSV